MLQNQEDGTFLFRLSSYQGYLAVSFVINRIVEHRLIEWSPTGYRLVVASENGPDRKGFGHHEEHQTLAEYVRPAALFFPFSPSAEAPILLVAHPRLAEAHSDRFRIPYTSQAAYDVSTLVDKIFASAEMEQLSPRPIKRTRQSVLRDVDSILDGIFGDRDPSRLRSNSNPHRQERLATGHEPDAGSSLPRKWSADEVEARRRREETNYSSLSSGYKQHPQGGNQKDNHLHPPAVNGNGQSLLALDQYREQHHKTSTKPLPGITIPSSHHAQATDAASPRCEADVAPPPPGAPALVPLSADIPRHPPTPVQTGAAAPSPVLPLALDEDDGTSSTLSLIHI